MNKQWYYSISVAVVVLDALLLLGIFKAIFGDYGDVNSNLFNTGIYLGTLVGLANIPVIYWIIKKYVS